jgi:hypothetical protein
MTDHDRWLLNGLSGLWRCVGESTALFLGLAERYPELVERDKQPWCDSVAVFRLTAAGQAFKNEKGNKP